MKKTISLILLMFMLVGVSACGFLPEGSEPSTTSDVFFDLVDKSATEQTSSFDNDNLRSEETLSAENNYSQSEEIEESTEQSTEIKEQMVWIPKSGSKYHSKASCSNMKDPSQVTKSEAEKRGYTPCKKCH